MKTKRPIDVQRDAAVTLKIGEDNDTSSAQEFLFTSNAGYVIKGNGVYKIQLADDIDPGRNNPSIPNLNQRVLLEGCNNEIVARILLTTKYLFDPKNSNIPPFESTLFEAALELTKHVLELHSMCSDLQNEIKEKTKDALSKTPSSMGLNLPAITGLETNLHNVIIKADKTKDAILNLYKLRLLPQEEKPKLDEYQKAIISWPKIEQGFLSSWEEQSNLFTLIRNIRNCSVHPSEGQRIILNDFQMNSNGKIAPPIIKVDDSGNKKRDGTPLGPMPISELLEFLQATMANCAEASVVFIKLLTLLNDNPFGEWVDEFEASERRHPLVRYYRSINIGGKPHILG